MTAEQVYRILHSLGYKDIYVRGDAVFVPQRYDFDDVVDDIGIDETMLMEDDSSRCWALDCIPANEMGV